MIDLQGKNVFISASFPSGERGEKYKPYDPGGIADAVCAFARRILANNGTLTMGCHPTITPLLMYISRNLEVKNALTVFESEWFEDIRSPQVDEIEKEELGFLKRTPKVDSHSKSLSIMRQAMIQHTCYSGALFIGGMEGIEQEYAMFSKHSPETLRARVAGPGGAAASLPAGNCETFGLTDFEQSRQYPYMAMQFVEALAKMPELSS